MRFGIRSDAIRNEAKNKEKKKYGEEGAANSNKDRMRNKWIKKQDARSATFLKNVEHPAQEVT
jgi:hypothetical protein